MRVYHTVKDDYHRFLAEFATSDAKSKVVEVPVMLRRQVPAIQKVQKTVEVPPVQYIGEIVDVPVVAQRQVPTFQTVQKTVEAPQIIEEVVEVPKIVSQDMNQQRCTKIIYCLKEDPSEFLEERRLNVPVVMQRQVPMPQNIKEIMEVIQLTPQERTLERIV